MRLTDIAKLSKDAVDAVFICKLMKLIYIYECARRYI